MRLSKLQKFILMSIFEKTGDFVLERRHLSAYYDTITHKPKNSEKIITRSIERLIGQGLLIGYGYKTSERWYIEEVRLTAFGKRTARPLQGQQLSLPLKRSGKVNGKKTKTKKIHEISFIKARHYEKTPHLS